MKTAPIESQIEPSIFVRYEIQSGINHIYAERYCQHISGTISTILEDDKNEMKVGRVEAFKVLLTLGRNNGYSSLEIFDLYRETMDIGQEIYDFRKNDFKNEVYAFCEHLLNGDDVLVLSRIEILPEYRGRSIGERVIKDLFDNFSSGCALFALKCYPLQCEAGIMEEEDPFSKSMNYEQLPTIFNQAFKSLSLYYKRMGFVNIPKISTQVMFINPAGLNGEFEAISCE